MARIEHIFIASQRGLPMQPVASIEAIAGKGLCGDRYAIAGHRRSADFQITLIELEHIQAFCRDTGLPMSPDMPRRNIVTTGCRLNGHVGKHVQIGGAVVEGLELCEPCNLFSKRTHREALRYFIGKGGLRARIVVSGTIQVGDIVEQHA
jgi:MOSC domain-containing protein YiiM